MREKTDKIKEVKWKKNNESAVDWQYTYEWLRWLKEIVSPYRHCTASNNFVPKWPTLYTDYYLKYSKCDFVKKIQNFKRTNDSTEGLKGINKISKFSIKWSENIFSFMTKINLNC